MAFDIMSLQRNRAPVKARSKADELAGRPTLKYIDVDDLVPSEDNFYSMSDIEELAALIELSGGVKQPALVVSLGGGKYKVIAGHRRRLASLQLVKQGKDEYRKMPCMVEDAGQGVEQDEEAEELRAIDEAILLITTNSQREKTDWDKVQEATRLRELLERKRRFEKIPGKTRTIIAEQLGTTSAQVGRYESIAAHMIPELKRWLEHGEIGISVAYELSTLPEEGQTKVFAEFAGKQRSLSLEDVRRRKEKAARQKPEEPPEQREPELPKVKPGVSVRYVETKTVVETPVQDGGSREPTTVPGVENTGKIVDFHAPSSPVPAPSAEPERETMTKRRAAVILDVLHMYCEDMMGADGELAETWAERADALTVAIDALRK